MVYDCPFCGASSHVWVVGQGAGSSSRMVLPIFGGGQALADESAAAAAERNLELTLRLATCPACHRADRRVLLRAQAPVAALAIALAAFGIGMLCKYALEGGLNWFAVLVFGLVCPALGYHYWTLRRWQWRTVTERLSFITEQEHARMEEEAGEALRRALTRRRRQTKRRRRGSQQPGERRRRSDLNEID